MYPLLHGLRRWDDSERALGKGSLSYPRGAYGVKNKMARSEWKSRMYNGPSAVCSASTSATRAMPWPPPAPPQAPRIPGEPIYHFQTRTTPRHPAERTLIAGLPPCFCQTRQTRRHKPKDLGRGASPGVWGNSRRVWRGVTCSALAKPLYGGKRLLDRLPGIGGAEYSYNRGHLSSSEVVRPL